LNHVPSGLPIQWALLARVKCFGLAQVPGFVLSRVQCSLVGIPLVPVLLGTLPVLLGTLLCRRDGVRFGVCALKYQQENILSAREALQGRVMCPGQSYLSRRYLMSSRTSQYSSRVVWNVPALFHDVAFPRCIFCTRIMSHQNHTSPEQFRLSLQEQCFWTTELHTPDPELSILNLKPPTLDDAHPSNAGVAIEQLGQSTTWSVHFQLPLVTVLV
jgi:hypothetical protein